MWCNCDWCDKLTECIKSINTKYTVFACKNCIRYKQHEIKFEKSKEKHQSYTENQKIVLRIAKEIDIITGVGVINNEYQ